ncbi:hypothetical protein PVK06_045213 [Gossypium arboreum]|uniref:RNase H type-1 domain-containing protein n=1 Tax=Gossypium arboreum TaxID=29729 RepID=A0ABR0MTG5_GOSAR|nr:hypothetical protein PVK06_045213 [Gossypium arboreum]
MIFSKGVNEGIQRRISGIFEFLVVQNLGSYLEVPLFHEKVTNNTLRFFVDKARSKLCSWNTKQLSLAGRITLGQSVLLSIPSYFMQSMMISKGLCDEIEDMVRQFICGSTSGNRKIALVSWDSICQPKLNGGLGIRSLCDQNTSFMMKLGFKLLTDCSSLWVKVLRSKYGVQGSLYEWIELNLRNKQEVNLMGGVNWAFCSELSFGAYGRTETYAYFKGIRTSRSDFIPLSLDGWVYLNTDGSVKNVDRFAVAGGLLREQDGNWIVGFTRYLGNYEVIDSELWGILDGVQIALDCGFRKVIIRIDNIEAVNLIHEGVSGGSNSALVMRIVLLLKSLSHWNLQHIPREENSIANRIVKLRRDRETGLRLLDKNYVMSFLIV